MFRDTLPMRSTAWLVLSHFFPAGVWGLSAFFMVGLWLSDRLVISYRRKIKERLQECGPA
jgi:hypothetical protein